MTESLPLTPIDSKVVVESHGIARFKDDSASEKATSLTSIARQSDVSSDLLDLRGSHDLATIDDTHVLKITQWRSILIISLVVLIGGSGLGGLLLQSNQSSILQEALFAKYSNQSISTAISSISDTFGTLHTQIDAITNYIYFNNITFENGFDDIFSLLPLFHGMLLTSTQKRQDFAAIGYIDLKDELFMLVAQSGVPSYSNLVFVNETSNWKCQLHKRYQMKLSNDRIAGSKQFRQGYVVNAHVQLQNFSICKPPFYPYIQTYQHDIPGPIWRTALPDSTFEIFMGQSIRNELTGEYIGVIASSLRLDLLSEILFNVTAGVPNSRLFLMEKSGKLIASSHGKLLHVDDSAFTDDRSTIFNVDDPLTRSAGLEINKTLNGKLFEVNSQNLNDISITMNGVEYFISLGPIQTYLAQHFRPVFVSSTASIMKDITASVNAALVLSIGLIVFSVILGVGTGYVISRPIQQIMNLTRSLKVQKSHLRRKNIELVELTVAADRANKAKTGFLSVISHETRTPLNGILGMAELLMVDTNPTPKQLEYLRTIQLCGRAELSLISQVLDLVKIESEQVSIEHISFNMRQLLSEVVEVASATALIKGDSTAAGVLVADDVPSVVISDPTRMRQCILNFAGNAVRYGSGFIGIMCFVVTYCEQRFLRIIVRDNGSGVPKSIMPKLFERFEQGNIDRKARAGGAGLGLAITKDLAHMLGGSVGVDSKEDVGSEFYIEVPLFVKHEENGLEHPKHHISIVVDDEDETVKEKEEEVEVEEEEVVRLNDFKPGTAVVVLGTANEYTIVDFVLRTSGLDIIHARDYNDVFALITDTAHLKSIDPFSIFSEVKVSAPGRYLEVIDAGDGDGDGEAPPTKIIAVIWSRERFFGEAMDDCALNSHSQSHSTSNSNSNLPSRSGSDSEHMMNSLLYASATTSMSSIMSDAEAAEAEVNERLERVLKNGVDDDQKDKEKEKEKEKRQKEKEKRQKEKEKEKDAIFSLDRLHSPAPPASKLHRKVSHCHAMHNARSRAANTKATLPTHTHTPPPPSSSSSSKTHRILCHFPVHVILSHWISEIDAEVVPRVPIPFVKARLPLSNAEMFQILNDAGAGSGGGGGVVDGDGDDIEVDIDQLDLTTVGTPDLLREKEKEKEKGKERKPKHTFASDNDTIQTLVAKVQQILSSESVLVVDDNRVNRALATGMIKKSKARVYSCVNGEDAVNYMKNALGLGEGGDDEGEGRVQLPKLVLMDVQMPVLDGLEATKQIRQLLRSKSKSTESEEEEDEKPEPDVVIIGLTALAFEEDRQRCLQVGMDSWLSKPFTLVELYSDIVMLFNDRQLKRQQVNR